MLRGEMFRKEIRQVVVGANERDAQHVVFDEFADVEVAAGNVLGAFVVLRIVGEVAGGLVVGGERHGAECRRATCDLHIVKNKPEVNRKNVRHSV